MADFALPTRQMRALVCMRNRRIVSFEEPFIWLVFALVYNEDCRQHLNNTGTEYIIYYVLFGCHVSTTASQKSTEPILYFVLYVQYFTMYL